MKNRKFDEFDLLAVSSHEMGEFMFRPEYTIERIISKNVEEDEFEIERVVKFVEEYGVKESARGLKLSEEEVVKNVSEYIKNVNRRIQDLETMVDQESSQMANDGKCGTEMQESRLKMSKEKGGDKSVHVQEMWTSKVVENREFVLLHTTKLVDIVGYREYELAQVIKVVESMNIEDSGHILGLEYLEVVDKVKEYIRLKKSRIEFLHNVVQESELMREKRGSAAMNTNEEPHLDNSVSLAVFVSHQELLCNESDEKKEGDKSVCVNERKGETESGQESHLKTLNEEGDKSVNEPVSGISGGMSTAGMQIGGQEYPSLAGRVTGQKQLSVKESNERDGQKTSNDEKEDGVFVHVEDKIVKESESKSGQESHLKSLDEEKEEGDKSASAHVEVRNGRERVLESGQMTLNEENVSGDKCVKHVEKIEREVKSESGQQMNEEKISTESLYVEAGNKKGSEEVTGSGMLTVSREVGDSMQVAACQGHGRGNSRDQQLQQSVYDREYAPMPGQTGQQSVKESEPKSGQGLHLKSLDEEKEEGDKSAAHVEVRDEKESRLVSGQMTLNEENEGGENSVNHFEQKNESEVKSDSGQEMNEEKVGTESVNAEAGNEKGSEKVTGSGMLTVSREVGDSMQVAAGQQPQNDLKKEDPPAPAPAPVQGALAPYIDFALARPSKPKRRGQKVHNVVQESELMREKRGSAATNINQEPHLDNSVSLAVFVSHQELLCNESDEKKKGEKSVCVNERNGEIESGQESHLKTLNEEGDKSVNEPVSGISGGMSTAGMQIGGHEYPPLPAGRLTGQKQLGVEESNERDSEPKSGQKTSNDEKEDGESVRVEKRTVKESESKSGQESHLKSLDEEKEKGDKSVNHVEVRNERESVLESGQMMSHEESESGDKCVNHVEKIERDVKSESGQQMKEEKISTETENVEAGNEKGSEEVTGSGMLTISREVGDSMQVAGQGNGRGSSRDQQLQQSVYDREYAPLPGQTGQQRVKESEPKSGQGLHLKLLDEEKEEGDKSADVEVGNERERVPESGQMTLNEENEGGGNSVNHFEQKNESEVKSDSGQEMNEEKVSTESVNAEAGNKKGSEKVTGSGMLTVSTEVGDMQVAAGQGHGSGSSSGQQQLQPSVNGRGWGRGYVSGQQPQNELPIEDPPAPAPVQGALAPYIDFALARPSRPNKRGKKVHK